MWRQDILLSQQHYPCMAKNKIGSYQAIGMSFPLLFNESLCMSLAIFTIQSLESQHKM